MTGNKISDYLPQTEILAQLAEEASELAQAALKLRRAMDGTNPTPKSVEECEENFVEEYADVLLCIHALLETEKYGLEKFVNAASCVKEKKQERWINRLKEKNGYKGDESNG